MKLVSMCLSISAKMTARIWRIYKNDRSFLSKYYFIWWHLKPLCQWTCFSDHRGSNKTAQWLTDVINRNGPMKRTNSSPFRSNRQRSKNLVWIFVSWFLIPHKAVEEEVVNQVPWVKRFSWSVKPSSLFFYRCTCLNALTGQFNCCCKTKDYLRALSIVALITFPPTARQELHMTLPIKKFIVRRCKANCMFRVQNR